MSPSLNFMQLFHGDVQRIERRTRQALRDTAAGEEHHSSQAALFRDRLACPLCATTFSFGSECPDCEVALCCESLADPETAGDYGDETSRALRQVGAGILCGAGAVAVILGSFLLWFATCACFHSGSGPVELAKRTGIVLAWMWPLLLVLIPSRSPGSEDDSP